MEAIRAFLRAFTPRRRVVYLIGLCFLAFGITMNTKSGLGMSPVISVAYIIAELLHIPIGVMTFFYYSFMILLQLLLLGKAFEHIQWLQIAASFLISFLIGLCDKVLPTAAGIPGRAAFLLLAIVLTGIGIILTVGAEFVPNPPDGAARAIAIRTGKSLGFSKNLLDYVCILMTLALGRLFRGQILCVGVGTVVTMLLTGRVVALLQKRVLTLAGLG